MVEKLRRLRTSAPGTTFSPIAESTDDRQSAIGLVKGAIIGGVYEIIEEIGRGGMGEVYLVRHTGLGKKCALKVVPPEKVDELGWMRFQNEARYIAQLSHINLVRVTDLGIHEGCLPFYAMDLVPGKTLADMIAARGRVGWPTALDIFIQVCDGLEHAHKHGIIHRDLKPANIMVADLDRAKISVKILDFGLAKLTDDRNKQSLTAVGEVFGSPFYMSPEQCDGQRVDARSDIYSLGCGFFEVLTGRPPFSGHLVQAIIFSHQEATPPTLASILGPGEVPESLEAVMSKLLAKKPAERYQTMAELREDLVKIKNGANLADPIGQASTSAARGGEGGAKAIAIVALTAVASALLGGLIVYKQIKPSTPAADISNPRSPAPPMAVQQNDLASTGKSGASTEASGQKLNGQPFSTVGKVFDAKGRPLRRFVFPDGVDLGYLSMKGGGDNKVSARGTVDFPADARLTFFPAGTFLRNSRYFPRFQKGDIDSLNLTNVMVPELQAATHIIGVRALIIESSAYIDDGCIGLIGKFENLESLQITDADMTGEGIANLSTLLRLKHLTVTACEQVDKLCQALEKSRSLTYLKLGSVELSDADFVSIAKIRGLEQLKLKGQNLSEKNLEVLSTLPHLAWFEIPSTRLTSDSIAVLQKFPALKKLRAAPMSKHDFSLVSEKLKGVEIEASSHLSGL